MLVGELKTLEEEFKISLFSTFNKETYLHNINQIEKQKKAITKFIEDNIKKNELIKYLMEENKKYGPKTLSENNEEYQKNKLKSFEEIFEDKSKPELLISRLENCYKAINEYLKLPTIP